MPRLYRVYFRSGRAGRFNVELLADSKHEAERAAFQRLPAFQRNRSPHIEYTSVQCDGQPLPGAKASSCHAFTHDESGRCPKHRPQEGHAA